MRCAAALLSLASIFALAACQGKPQDERAKRELSEDEASVDPLPEGDEDGARMLEAAGLRLKLPATWDVLPSANPNFAMGLSPAPKGTQTFSCVIELRRQGRGELSPAAKLTKASRPDDLRYNQGPLHGRLREFDGPTPDAALLAHCRGPRSSSDWGAIDAALDTLATAGPPKLAPKLDAPKPESVAELCVGTPSRKTYVCARRHDGAVFCGMSADAELARIGTIPASVQIGCDGVRACSRDAEGQISCWMGGTSAEAAPVPALGKVSELAGNCVVSEGGAVSCRARREDGMTLDSFAPLLPLGKQAHALAGVTQVLAGSSDAAGCVVAQGQLRCWDELDSLDLELEGLDSAPQLVAEVGEVDDLMRLTKRFCTASGDSWTCRGGPAPTSFAPCSSHACGCDLIGTGGISCEHELHARLDSQTFGHIAGVTSVAGACAGLIDGRVVCRGPRPKERGDSEEIRALVTGKVPGILHELKLVEQG